MLFFIKTIAKTRTAKASFLTVLAIMPSLYSEHASSVPVVKSGTSLSTFHLTDQPAAGHVICCTKHSPKMSKTEHEESPENHRRYNRRSGERRIHDQSGAEVERRQYDPRRTLVKGDDRRGSSSIQGHYVHSVVMG